MVMVEEGRREEWREAGEGDKSKDKFKLACHYTRLHPAPPQVLSMKSRSTAAV